MKNIKNYAIVILSALLVFSVSIQPAQSAIKKSKEAKIVEYDHCITIQTAARPSTQVIQIDEIFANCAKYRP